MDMVFVRQQGILPFGGVDYDSSSENAGDARHRVY